MKGRSLYATPNRIFDDSAFGQRLETRTRKKGPGPLFVEQEMFGQKNIGQDEQD
jgi:hypothetical protein